MTDKEIDKIHILVDNCIKYEQFEIIDYCLNLLHSKLESYYDNCFEQHICNEILTWLTATLPIKSKLLHREDLLREAKRVYKDECDGL